MDSKIKEVAATVPPRGTECEGKRKKKMRRRRKRKKRRSEEEEEQEEEEDRRRSSVREMNELRLESRLLSWELSGNKALNMPPISHWGLKTTEPLQQH